MLGDLGMVLGQVCGKASSYAKTSQILALSLRLEQFQLPVPITVP